MFSLGNAFSRNIMKVLDFSRQVCTGITHEILPAERGTIVSCQRTDVGAGGDGALTHLP